MNNTNAHKPGYKHTPLGWIPEEWNIYSVGRAFEICNNLRFPISEEVRKGMQGKYPYYGPTKVQDYINEYRVDGKYALIGEDGDHFLKWRELPMTILAEGKFNVNNHAHLIKGSTDSITEWFYYYYQHKELTTYLTRQGAGRYKLTKDALSKMPISLPPLPEQQKIASILSTWDEAIQKTQQLIEQLKQRNKGLMQQLLTGKKRLKGFSGKWRKRPANELFKSVSKKNNGNEPLLSVTQDRGVIPRDMLEGRVTMPDGSTEGYKLVEHGDFIISLRSFQGGLEYSEYRGIVSPAYTVLKPVVLINDSFYKYYYKSYDFIGHLAVAVIGIRDGKQISFEDFSALSLPYPPLEEQGAIAAVLAQAYNELNLQEQQLTTLQEQKKGLMQKLLSGEVRVNISKASIS